MLGFVDRFSDRRLTFPWEQNMPHYWLTCFPVPMGVSFYISSIRIAKESLLILSYGYIDDLISFNNKRLQEFISDIYPKEVTTSETTESTSVASYLDLIFTRDENNNITTKLYDKRDAFGVQIVNFLFMSRQYSSSTSLRCLFITAHLLCLLLFKS